MILDARSPETVALVVLRANLGKFLLPLIEKWPGSSASARNPADTPGRPHYSFISTAGDT